jgi:hypothetical protein
MGKVLSLANLAIARYISLTPAVRTLMLLQVVALLLNLCGAFEPPKTLRNVPLDRSDVGRTGLSPEPTCGQYLAPSILPGAGLGMYSGVEIEEDDPVSYGDICIPLIDLKLVRPFTSTEVCIHFPQCFALFVAASTKLVTFFRLHEI